MSSGSHAHQQQLEDAFHLFNQVSGQLTDSYQRLQEEVIRLNAELTAARTERLRQLAEKARLANRLSHLLEVLPAAVIVVDDRGHVQESNPAATQLFGDIIPDTPWSELCRNTFAGEQPGGELHLRDGRLVTLSERSLAPEPGRILLLLDITETHELKERVNRQERLSTLGQMAAQLAHQIRTPLAAALLDASNLAGGNLSAERREQFSSRLQARLQHMEHQIKEMLAFARGGQGNTVTLVPVTPLIRELGHILEPLLRLRRARFELVDRTGGCFFIKGNRPALLGALMNLASNALEHGGAGVHLKVELNIAPGARLNIRICDNGPGIPQELAARVFDPFFTTSSDGTGLGLAVVQSIILSHGGEISSVQPSTGEGACFQLCLPLADGNRLTSDALGTGTTAGACLETLS